jgi:carbamoyl-phosphate synthase large subunit
MSSPASEPGSVPVLVTGVGGGGVGEQIVKALRLGEVRYTIVGTDVDERSLGFGSVDHPHVVPSARHGAYLDALVTLCERYQVRAIFPGSEPELSAIAGARARFADLGVVVPVSPPDVIDTCLDKFRTSAWLRSHGFQAPQARLIQAPGDLDLVDFNPAVLKPSSGGGGSANVFISQSDQEVHALGRYLLDTVGTFVAQEYVGDVRSEFTVGVLTDLDGRLVDSIAVRRNIESGLGRNILVPNRSESADLGELLGVSSGISQGEIGRFREVAAEAEQIAVQLGARGPINIQCRLWKGRPYVFEINPRFSGTSSVRALVGYNEPDWLVRRHVLGEALAGPIDYRSAYVTRGLVEAQTPAEPSAREPH